MYIYNIGLYYNVATEKERKPLEMSGSASMSRDIWSFCENLIILFVLDLSQYCKTSDFSL